jgi:pimeloyl-ACP methyl ester carboxylesterase
MIRAYRHAWSRWKLGRGATNARSWSAAETMVVPLVNAGYLHERLPNSELHLVDSGHFVWEDAADEYAALVNAWWAGGYKTCGKSTGQGAA